MALRYQLAMPEPHSHLFHVELSVDDPGAVLELAMPVWTPGSYLVREFARHLEGLSAIDEKGAPLTVERVDKQRFRVQTGSAARAVVRYRVYANELTVRTSHLDGSHGFVNGANVFLYVPGRERETHALELALPDGWRASTSLAGSGAKFEAPDYDTLVDSPIEMGRHATSSFEVAGKRHELAIYGRGNLDLERLTRDTLRIVETCAALMGPLPYDRYLFIVHLADKRGGGLEHLSSTTLNVDRNAFAPREAYEETLSLIAHEFFHAWNVKRLKPAAFIPFDYTREQYTRLLWWFEGATSYYDHLLLVRAGLLDPRRYLKHLGEALTALERIPGARKMSLEEASLLSWVKYYRPDENSQNSGVSYYLKGELVAWSLDLALRAKGSSLDALMRKLYERYAAAGVPENSIESTTAELIGKADATRFFDRYVRGTAAWEAPLDAFGLRLRRRVIHGWDDKGGTPPRADPEGRVPGWLGINWALEPRLLVGGVREGSPAHRAGLYAGDEIIAEGGFKIDKVRLWEILMQRGPKGRVALTVFRRNELVAIEVPLAEPPQDWVWLELHKEAGKAQRGAFEAWSGAAFPE